MVLRALDEAIARHTERESGRNADRLLRTGEDKVGAPAIGFDRRCRRRDDTAVDDGDHVVKLRETGRSALRPVPAHRSKSRSGPW